MTKWLALALTSIFACAAQAAVTPSQLRMLSDKAAIALDEIANNIDSEIPLDLLGGARCVAVVPELTRASLIFGGEYGLGLVTCLTPDNQWSAPSIFRLGGLGVGFQAGYADIDLVMVFMAPNSPSIFQQSQYTIDACVTGAAGPWGRHSAIGEDIGLTSSLFAYSTASGAYIGLALQGSKIWPANDYMKAAYGATFETSSILSGLQKPPGFAQRFIQKVELYTNHQLAKR